MKYLSLAAVFLGPVLFCGCASYERQAALDTVGPAPVNRQENDGDALASSCSATEQTLAASSKKAPASATAAPTAPVEPSGALPGQAKQLVKDNPNTDFLEHVPDLEFTQTKPNKISLGQYTLSGMAIQFIKAANPLQLFNPSAPAPYGSGVDNLNDFTFSGTGPLLTVFSVSF
jgi:hypothetical protein